MFKPLCAIILWSIVGFSLYQTVGSKVALDVTPVIKRERDYDIGKTKSGEPCIVVEAWADGASRLKQDRSLRRQKFLIRNSNSSQIEQHEIKYDCFLDIDTQEYRLAWYEKMEYLEIYTETLKFNHRNTSALFEYVVECTYKDSRKKEKCTAYKK